MAFGGGRFLVVWGDPRRGDRWINGAVLDVYAARVAPDGTLLDGPAGDGGIAVNAHPGQSKLDPVVAFDGARFVVTWWIDGYYGDYFGVYAARVGGDGTVLDEPTGTGLPIAHGTAYGSLYVHPVAAPAADGQTLVAWIDNNEAYGTTKGLLGAWYGW